MNGLLIYDENDENDPPEPRRRPYDDLENEQEQAPTVYERNPLMLLP